MRILIVDDSMTMRKIIGNVLTQLKVKRDEFDEGANGAEALALIREHEYDVILTDWNMPVMNGLDLVKNIRREPGVNQKKPIVMITTEGGKEQVIEALKAGVNNYIVKPFSAEILKMKIKDIKGINLNV